MPEKLDLGLMELLELRTANQKTFLKSGGWRELHGHAGHIHYFNKLGVGDGEIRWREIDYTLQWDDVKRGWYFEYHSFQPFLPEYADEWVEFRDVYDGKDQTVRYRAVAAHVKGELQPLPASIIDGKPDTQCVIYPDAFGVGADYILYFTRSALKKTVRIREGYYNAKNALTFDFEFDNGSKDVFRGLVVPKSQFESKGEVVYQLDTAREKVFDTDKYTLVGQDQNDGHEWFTYLRPFLAWDSGGEERIIQPIEAKFYLKDGKQYLQKIIPVSFLEKAKGDIFTDTTTSFYSGAGDGFLQRDDSSSSWDAVHDATSANTTDYTSTTELNISSWNDVAGTANRLRIRRTAVPIDLSTLPDSSGATTTVIQSASFFGYVSVTQNSDNDGDDWIVAVETTTASTSTLTANDYDNIGAVNNPTEGSGRHDISSISTGAYLEMALNATGLSWITTSGFIKLGFREGHDAIDSPIVGSNSQNLVRFVPSEASGTSQDPYLSVTYKVVTKVTPTKSLTYRVQKEIVKTKSLTYRVTSEHVVTKSLTYRVTSQQSVTKSLTYRVVTPQSATKSLTYRVQTTAAVTKSLTYLVTSVQSVTKSLNYLVSSTQAATKSLTYAVTSTTAIQKSLTYSIAGAATPIVVQLSLTYRVVTSAAATKSLTYRVTVSNSTTKSLHYVVVSAQSVTKSLQYAVVTEQSATKSLTYLVTANQALTKSLTYRVTATAAAVTKSLTYRVAVSTAATKSLTYIVVSEHAVTKSLKYTIISHVAITKSLTYEIGTPFVEGVVTKSLTYRVTAQQTLTKSLTYIVIKQTAVLKSLTYVIFHNPYSVATGVYSKDGQYSKNTTDDYFKL